MIIGVDVDDVVADLVSEWLRLYNIEHKDNVWIDQIKTWEIFDFVKCGHAIYDFLKLPTLYDNMQPISDAKWGVDMLRKGGHRVVFITSCVLGQFDQKWTWLKRNGFLDDKLHANDFIAATDKILLNVDLMIDDKPGTVEAFEERGLLFKRPWNNGVATWKSIVADYVRQDVRKFYMEVK